MTTRHLFATQIHALPIGNDTLRASLERCAWLLEEEDAAGNAWCDAEGYPGYTSYASLDDLPSRFPEFADLKRHLDKAAASFAREHHWDMDGFSLVLDALWVNILGEDGHHSGHIHPGSVISGTYYVSVPDGSGRIKFEDPRLGLMMAAPQLLDTAPEDARRFIYIQPEAGTCLLWESWLRHEVMTSQSEEARISISFNYGLKRKG